MSMIKEDLMFGRIAVLNHMISEEQLTEAIAIQKQNHFPRPLGLILLEKGYITKPQLKAILETQKKRLPRPAITLQERREDIAFAYLVVKHKHLDVETIYNYLQYQGDLVKKGLLFRLSEVLVNHGLISLAIAEQMIELQNSQILECGNCQTKYNTVGMQPNSEFICKKCDAVLQVPASMSDENEAQAIENFRLVLEQLADQHQKKIEQKQAATGNATTSPTPVASIPTPKTVVATTKQDPVPQPTTPKPDAEADEKWKDAGTATDNAPDYVDLQGQEAIPETDTPPEVVEDRDAENYVDLQDYEEADDEERSEEESYLDLGERQQETPPGNPPRSADETYLDLIPEAPKPPTAENYITLQDPGQVSPPVSPPPAKGPAPAKEEYLAIDAPLTQDKPPLKTLL